MFGNISGKKSIQMGIEIEYLKNNHLHFRKYFFQSFIFICMKVRMFNQLS